MPTLHTFNQKHFFCFELQTFSSDLWQVGGFLRVIRFPPPINLTEILLKVALNTIKPNQPTYIQVNRITGIMNSVLALSGVGAPGGSNQGLSNWYLLLFR